MSLGKNAEILSTTTISPEPSGKIIRRNRDPNLLPGQNHQLKYLDQEAQRDGNPDTDLQNEVVDIVQTGGLTLADPYQVEKITPEDRIDQDQEVPTTEGHLIYVTSD